LSFEPASLTGAIITQNKKCRKISNSELTEPNYNLTENILELTENESGLTGFYFELKERQNPSE
jgi:hypothetical protein